jgi:hypothetical protein
MDRWPHWALSHADVSSGVSSDSRGIRRRWPRRIAQGDRPWNTRGHQSRIPMRPLICSALPEGPGQLRPPAPRCWKGQALGVRARLRSHHPCEGGGTGG